jgi:hypothetical protein
MPEKLTVLITKQVKAEEMPQELASKKLLQLERIKQ